MELQVFGFHLYQTPVELCVHLEQSWLTLVDISYKVRESDLNYNLTSEHLTLKLSITFFKRGFIDSAAGVLQGEGYMLRASANILCR